MGSADCVYQPKESRISADFDNERPYDEDVVGLTKTDEVSAFGGRKVEIKEGDYIYLYMDVGDGDYVFSEGAVIRNPYSSKPYRWCCQLKRELEYMSEYELKFR